MTPDGSAGSGATYALVHLSGSGRGSTNVLEGTLSIGSGAGASLRLDGSDAVSALHATLDRDSGGGYTIRVEPGQRLWLNGRSIESASLQSGDVLEIGRGGPVLRFRRFAPGRKPYKTVQEAFSDCWECARHGQRGPFARVGAMAAAIPRELASQTAPAFRLTVVFLLAMLGIIMSALVVRSLYLERRLDQEALKVEGVAELLARAEETSLRTDDLANVQSDFEGRITSALDRLEALEARTRAGQQVVLDASRSVVFLQGSYGFLDKDTAQPLRYAGLDDSGRPIVDLQGDPIVTLGGDGPPVENLFTGTAFVAHESGHLVTNRHVATPWEFDAVAQLIAKQGLTPRLRRFLGYLPGLEQPFRVELVAVSPEADVAILLCGPISGEVPVLPLSAKRPEPGQEVIVLGYPAGVRALLARSSDAFLAEIRADPGWDFWSLARRLSEEGMIAPLATRGIVGHVSDTAVVYDAETTSGGSGGPVLDLDGHVIAINAAVLPEFGGSNLGVPAFQAQALLDSVARGSDARGPDEASDLLVPQTQSVGDDRE